jgi:Tol biopolymer transport system component
VVSAKQQIGIFNLRNGSEKIRWLAGPADMTGRVDWAADGEQLVYVTSGKTRDMVRLVVANGVTMKITATSGDIACVDSCNPAWMPNGKLITFPAMAKKTGESSFVMTYSAVDGRQVGSMSIGPVPGLRSWSPDGSLVVVEGGGGAEVVDPGSGTVIMGFGTPANGVYWSAANQLYCVDDTGVTVYDLKSPERTDHYPMPLVGKGGPATSLVLGRTLGG